MKSFLYTIRLAKMKTIKYLLIPNITAEGTEKLTFLNAIGENDYKLLQTFQKANYY